MKDVITVKGAPATIDYGLLVVEHKRKKIAFKSREEIFKWLTTNGANPNAACIVTAERLAKETLRSVDTEAFKLSGHADWNYRMTLEYTIKFLQDQI